MRMLRLIARQVGADAMTLLSAEEKTPMGRVVVEAKVENIEDLVACKLGHIAADQVRSVLITNALVDKGATLLSLPTNIIQRLGLSKAYSKRVTTSKGIMEADVYSAVRLTIQGRSCTMDVLEVPDSVPALIGQIPLEQLDFVINPRECKLTGNPEHGGEHMFELY
jgi:predicted aspartyl protease